MTATHAHHLRTALPLFLFAGLCLSSLDATAKYLVQGHSVFLVVWARYLGQMAVVTPFAWHRAGHGFWRTQHLKLQLARSLCLARRQHHAATSATPLAAQNTELNPRVSLIAPPTTPPITPVAP